ncbi:MAG: RtcB family protein, partial [Myxococcota bacterium]
MRRWLAEPLDADTRRALERIERLDDVVEVAVMPDAHLAKDVCIGTVTATRSRIFPSAVGGDIGCGMGALPLGVPASRVNERTAPKILDAFARHIPILKHRTAPTPWEGEPCRLSHGSLERKQAREGRLQLGTVGRGNHFVELQEDDLGNLWLMVHSGSRAMGQSITA